MSDVTELVEFLRARLDEDSEAAEATLDIGVRARIARGKRAVPRWEFGDGAIRDTDGILRVKFTWRDSATHIVRHDPARVLAEIDAKRALLAAVASAKRDRDHWHACPPNDPEERAKVIAGIGARWSAWQFVLGQLAKPYGDHPGFREEWWRHLV